MLSNSTGFPRVLWERLHVMAWREAEVLLEDEEERVRFPAWVRHPRQRHVLPAMVPHARYVLLVPQRMSLQHNSAMQHNVTKS